MAEWLTAPLEMAETNETVICSVLADVSKFRNNPRFRYRVEICWSYSPAANGMPRNDDAELIEKADEELERVFQADPVAVMTGVYTGSGKRTIVFYTLSLHIFQRKLNEALASLPELPLAFSAEDDPEWEEYAETAALVRGVNDGAADVDVVDEGMD